MKKLKESQCLLATKYVSSFKEEDYIVTRSNRTAWMLVKNWPDWGNTPLSTVIHIHGERGSGKSHLASIWQKKADAHLVTRQLLESREFLATNYILDGIETLLNLEQNVLHLFNYVVGLKKFMFITSRQPAPKLGIKLPDLYSRMQGIVSLKIENPDDQMVEAIITKYFSDFQILVSAQTIKYLVQRIARSYSAMTDTLLAIDQASLVKKSPVSIALIKSILEQQFSVS